MEYKNRIEFASRSIELYKSYSSKYEFTAAAGVLLNVLTSICPENEFLIDVSVENIDELPALENNSNEYIKNYLLNIRHALAHKTERNFIDYTRQENIAELQLTSNIGIITRLNIEELKSIIRWLEKKISKRLCTKQSNREHYA